MTINVPVDESLLREATRLTGEPDAEKALQIIIEKGLEALQRWPIDAMLDLVGKVELRDDYDYKALRTGGSDPKKDAGRPPRKDLTDLVGKIDFDPDFDQTKVRRTRYDGE